MSDAQIKDENPTPSPEELKLEEEALLESNEDEVRSQVIEKYNLDEIDHEELIESLTKDTIEQRKSFGKVVKQKRNWRDKATKEEEVKPKEETPEVKPNADIETLLNEKFEQRDLDELDFPDDLKPEISKVAKLKGVSVREAAKDAYIIHLKEQYVQEEKVNESAVKRTNKGINVKFDASNPPQVDMSTEEGRKEWDDYTNFMKTQ